MFIKQRGASSSAFFMKEAMMAERGEERLLIQIRSRILDSGRDTRYGLDAYGFVLTSLDYYRSKTDDLGHIPADVLVQAVVELAHLKYGPMALTVLKDWGLESPHDVGNVVYNLIDIEVFSQDTEDSLDDFVVLPSFEKMCADQTNFVIDKERIKIFIDA